MFERIASGEQVELASAYVGNVHGLRVGTSGVEAMVSTPGGQEMSTSVLSGRGFQCTCGANATGPCWHVVATLMAVPDEAEKQRWVKSVSEHVEGKQMSRKDDGTEYVEMKHLTELNRLVDGVPRGTCFAIVGPPEAGKTILLVQMAFECALAKGQSAIVMDTEGNAHSYANWVKGMAKRYECAVNFQVLHATVTKEGVSLSALKGKPPFFIVLDVRSIEKVLALHGRAAEIVVNGAKMDLVPKEKGWAEGMPVQQLVQSIKATFVGYDSVSSPLLEFGSLNQNFPARATAANWWLLRVERLAEEENVVAVALLHASVNPQDQFSRPHHTGGKTVGHIFKFMLYFSHLKSTHTPATQKRPNNVRECWLMRHPYKAPWETYVELALNADGFSDYKR